MALPVVPIRRSALLAGQSNGRLTSSIVRAVPGRAGGAAVTLVIPAARAWAALADAAGKAGHTLKVSAPSSSYRTYAEQEAIFRARYRTAYKANTDVKVWNGVRWYRWTGATAAVPGTSNHGWAQAVDSGEERDGDAGADPLDQATLVWLLAHADDYGWSWELQSEPWHLHYFAGDAIPAAVLAYEAGQAPAPAPIPVVDDLEASMFLARCAGTREVWLFEPGKMTHLKSRADVEALAAAMGVPLKEAELSFQSWAPLIRGRQQVK